MPGELVHNEGSISQLKVVILAGGFGTRLSEETILKPKPMVEIGGRPLLWHIMKIYSTYGFNEFVVALGYKSEVVKGYFLNYYYIDRNLSIDLMTGKIDVYDGERDNWLISLIDTGLSTQTGGRIRRLRQFLGNETFMLTYGDGVSDVDLSEVLAFHRRHGKLATVTAVRPPARFGALSVEGDQVLAFLEKSITGESRINGGFFVLEPEVLNYIDDDSTIWERDPLERLAAEGQLMAYTHDGFWQPMDTLRDKQSLEALWQSGKAPWRVWTHDYVLDR